MTARLHIEAGKKYRIVNASDEESVVLDLRGEKRRAESFTATGASCGNFMLNTGLSSVKIPLSGLLTL